MSALIRFIATFIPKFMRIFIQKLAMTKFSYWLLSLLFFVGVLGFSPAIAFAQTETLAVNPVEQVQEIEQNTEQDAIAPAAITSTEVIPTETTSALPIDTVSTNVTRLLQTNECVGCNLAGAVLKDANLQAANLANANLENVDLERTNLQRANLTGANLRGVDLGKVNLAGANLENANLFDADLEKANLQGANLMGANLQGADLEKANLLDVNIQGANLQGANLEDAIAPPAMMRVN